ncbi:RhoGAP-domain-containing protein [Calocera viscosa TUFC12733]|uniref:RhoGAP-domain-containing protein n=1 Tax=Calocera viscosa (strain TUFC12733) TaxID=1330018 RepID=A0A167MB05_CALVF|nr:RhoGAP-domain-containing protein [Calocera viscosa TUFC12733]
MHGRQSLKSRLAGLAAATQSSISSMASSSAMTGEQRRSMPWKRSTNLEDDFVLEYDPQKLDAIMEGLITQAGVDYETRPMVVMTAAAMPDPKEVSYDLLLGCVLSTLDLYVESDYTVVFFASGAKYNPGWSWVWKAYRSLSRKYRKNLKKLYIVHSSLFSKILVSMAGAIISPKFFRKIQYVKTLSDLAQYIPITQINIAPEVYKENLKYEKTITLPEELQHAAVFRVPLDQLIGPKTSGSIIPLPLRDCADYIRSDGLDIEGLFRRSPNSVMLRQAQDAYDRGNPVTLSSFGDPHLAAVLFKIFFHELPEPLFPESSYSIIRRCPPASADPNDTAAINYIRDEILPALSENGSYVLAYALHLMHDVSLHSTRNKMDATNLAICFSPNLVRSRNPGIDVQMCQVPTPPAHSSPGTPTPRAPAGTVPSTLGMVLKICIERYFEIFDEYDLDASTLTASRSSHSLPQSVPSTLVHDNEEDIDDADLVMTVETSPSMKTGTQRKFIPGHRRNETKDSEVSLGSLLSDSGETTIDGHAINAAIANAAAGRSPRNTMRSRSASQKSAASGVETTSMMASGFFTPPSHPSSPKKESQQKL